MSKRVTIFGGSGFVGRYIARRMVKAGWQVRLAGRSAVSTALIKGLGDPSRVESVLCDIRDDQSVSLALDGADAVVNCVGTFDATGPNSFDAIHVEGAGRIARFAAKKGILTMVHLSAIGADALGGSGYARSKAAGEAAVRAHIPEAHILRPSVIFGAEDQFFNRFAGMSKMGPALPLVGAETRFQPVFVDDVALAAEMALLGTAAPGVYELGGPDVKSFADWMRAMLSVIDKSRLIVPLPFPVGRLMAAGFTTLEKVTLGFAKNTMITFDQVKSLATDNVVSGQEKVFSDLGITPKSAMDILPTYLGKGPNPSSAAA